MLEQPDDRTFQFSEIVDVGNHPLADFPADRGSESNLVRRQIDGAARENATLATRVTPVRDRILSGNADDDTNVALRFDDSAIATFRLIQRHDCCSGQSNRRKIQPAS
jgi:hypothetical protein